MKFLLSTRSRQNTIFQLLKKVTEVSSEVKFGVGSDYGAPEVLFEGIAVSGK